MSPQHQETILRQSTELRETLNLAIAGFLNAPRQGGEIVSMTALVMGATAAIADLVVTVTPPGPLRTNVSMMAVENLGSFLAMGATEPNDPEAVQLHFEPSPNAVKN